ncbi:hypothetical protein BDQ12DRAFT_157479 [Crucibulum laeve]|uniref:Uncharacterized protein n=1 Tax=Crucibulum laeve TaxID=68775 RepID=A0A5C3LVW4_9AGAR|nr:hypothetical protein BDQ12DRAFT_157479 [Crucibulum laeve]
MLQHSNTESISFRLTIYIRVPSQPNFVSRRLSGVSSLVEAELLVAIHLPTPVYKPSFTPPPVQRGTNLIASLCLFSFWIYVFLSMIWIYSRPRSSLCHTRLDIPPLSLF